jgi:hypothetical protein
MTTDGSVARGDTMTRIRIELTGIVLAFAAPLACGGADGTPAAGSSSGHAETTSDASISSATEVGSTTEVGGTTEASNTTGDSTTADDTSGTADSTSGGPLEIPTCEELPGLVQAYQRAHPGNGGKDFDINAKTPAEIEADPQARQLLSLCPDDQRPVIPELAWEYGGGDHRWIAPQEGALFYCVYIPAESGTEHWVYDEPSTTVTADVSIGCPQANPCNDELDADQVLLCVGDLSNMEIVVDVASLNDGVRAGLELSEASTELMLLLADGTRVPLWTDV